MSHLKKYTGMNSSRTLYKKHIDVDLAVIGGGLAGICTAVAAARQGCCVALIQDRPVLGGNSSSEIRLWSLGATSHMGNNNRWAKEGGIIGEILEENMYRNREGNPLIFDTILLEFVKKNTNIQLFLNTAVFDASSSQQTVHHISAFNSQNSTMYHIKAPLFCDASGDGIVGYLTGADFRVGAESKDEFQELFAPDNEYGYLMGHSIYFYTRTTPQPIQYIAPSFALNDITKIPRYRSFNAKEDGCNLWWIEYGGRLDTVHDTEEIKWQLWEVVYGVWDHIKNSGQFPDAQNMTLEWVGHIPGKRESRRFQGTYMLNQRDIIEQKNHDDAVYYGGWSIDLHPADGVFSDDSGCHQWHSKGIYQIPFRVLYSHNINNLFIAGRIISVSHVAFGSTRVMLTCALGGEVVGTAAALCSQKKLQPKDIALSENIEILQQQLLRNGNYIPHIPYQFQNDVVSQAHIEASSVCQLNTFVPENEWQKIDRDRAMLIPCTQETLPAFQWTLKANQSTSIKISLRKSIKLENYTPDILIETKQFYLKEGTQTLYIDFCYKSNENHFLFICISANDHASIALSNDRIPGVLSLSQKGNSKVATSGRQEPPPNIGIDSFDFWLPERRPGGKLFATKFEQALSIYQPSFLKNGWHRPCFGATNGWVPDPDDSYPTLILKWETKVTLQHIHLYLDNDFDHPMETVQWGHLENVTPFCCKKLEILDDQGHKLFLIDENRKSHIHVTLDHPIQTQNIVIHLLESYGTHPIIYGVSCY